MSVAVSDDDAWIVSGSKDRGVIFWDSKNVIVQCVLQGLGLGYKNSGSGEFLVSFPFLFIIIT